MIGLIQGGVIHHAIFRRIKSDPELGSYRKVTLAVGIFKRGFISAKSEYIAQKLTYKNKKVRLIT